MNDVFLDLVQRHERSWGTENYPERPDLAAILSARVVAFWLPIQPQSDAPPARTPNRTAPPPRATAVERYTITLHDDLTAIESYFVKLLRRSTIELPNRRLARFFVDKVEMRVAKVNLTFEPLPPK